MDVRKKALLGFIILFLIAITMFYFIFFSVKRDDIGKGDLQIPSTVSLDKESIDRILNEEISLDKQNEIELEIKNVIDTIIDVSPSNTSNERISTGEVISVEEAVYKVEMRTPWSRRLHPNFYPDGAHMSPMVAWSHRIKNILFQEGGIATKGLEDVAETGATGNIKDELEDLIERNFVYSYQRGKRIDAPGSDSIQIRVSTFNPMVTVISMIAPSPDWFVAARNVNLYENNNWVQSTSVDATLYDAGTDSGNDFEARNINTNPKIPISVKDYGNKLPIATFVFTLIN